MSAPLHTPGPWTDDERGFLGSDGRMVGEWEPGKPAAEEYPRVMADRRLRAAAPELLEALEAITAHYVAGVNSGDCGFWNPEEEPQVIAARAAIAKARVS